ncbi:MAG TPA: transglutaminase family protein, partial [Methanoregula sp.]|nr:transglutaminase family protein [Methanoregula sp.]
LFEHIRDIPYSFSVRMTDRTTAPEQILTVGRGYCGPKHYLLAEMYRKLGLEVVYDTFPFYWNDPDLRYPPGLRILAAAVPIAYHLACRVLINGRWVLVDATWDPALRQGGFPINESWDGLSETRCAVKPLHSSDRTANCGTVTNDLRSDSGTRKRNAPDGEQNHRNEAGRTRYRFQGTGIRAPEDMDKILRFYPAFEAWLESLRNKQE